MTFSRFGLGILLFAGIAACDSADPDVPLQGSPPEAIASEVVTAGAPAPEAFSTTGYASWVSLASFDVSSGYDFDYYYTVMEDGLESSHAVQFLSREKEVVLEYRFLGRSSLLSGGKGGAPSPSSATAVFDVEAQWPLIDRSSARFLLFDEGEVMYDAVVVPDSVSSWASLGVSTFAGRSIHRKPGRLSVDNQSMQVGEQGVCTPVAKTEVSCTDYELRFGQTMVPEIAWVEVVGPASATFSLHASGQ